MLGLIITTEFWVQNVTDASSTSGHLSPQLWKPFWPCATQEKSWRSRLESRLWCGMLSQRVLQETKGCTTTVVLLLSGPRSPRISEHSKSERTELHRWLSYHERMGSAEPTLKISARDRRSWFEATAWFAFSKNRFLVHASHSSSEGSMSTSPLYK